MSQGTTIVLTTHYLEEAERLAHRVAVIARGKIVEVATPAALGGRDQATATVAWTDREGVRRSATTPEPTRTVKELAAIFDGEVPGLVITRPTLEDVHLSMVAES